MSQPFTFDTTSPRFALPLLFAGQSQKEIFVNEAHSLTDALLHCSIEGSSTAPPATPSEGENWLVGSAATGEWENQDGAIACRQAGNWLFVAPRDGMRIFDRSKAQLLLYDGDWNAPAVPASPSGGTTIDVEARAAIDALFAALRVAGIFPES